MQITKKLNHSRRSKLAFKGWLCLWIVAIALSGCAGLLGPDLPTPLPTAYLPTVIALTVEAGKATSSPTEGVSLPAATSRVAEATATAIPTASPTPQPSPTFTPSGPTATPYTLPPPPSPTPTPVIPNAGIEIRNLGPLSKVTSPLHLYAYLKPGAGGKVRIELLGEDHRLLARQIKVLNFVPVGAWAVFTTDLDFEISATAEVGRLQLSVDDEHGRTVALNSVPLILLSVGSADIVPPADVLSPIVIQEPTPKTLIQGGKVLVSGMARTSGEQPLLVRFISADGKEVGMRLANVSPPPDGGGYGLFAVEVPYTVSQPTQVLLTVSEGESSVSDIIHLSSLEVVVSP